MRMEFAYSCGCNRLVMDMCGLWPKDHSNFIQKNWALITAIVILIVIIIPRFAAITLFWNDIDAVVQCFSTQLLFISVVVKLLVMYFRNEVNLLRVMEEDFSKNLTTIEYTIVFGTAKTGRMISIFLIASAFCNVIAGIIAMKLYHLDSLYIKNPDSRLSLDFFWVTYLPFSTEDFIPYITVFVLQLCASSISGFYFIFDSFVVMLILHVCGQLKLIQISLKHLGESLTLTEGRNLRMTLGNIMEQHQRACRFARNLEQSFNLAWFYELTSCTLTLCFQTYIIQKLLHANQTSIFQMGFPICAAVGILMKFFLNCWAGEYLISQSSEIGCSFYETDWYKLPPADARLLMMFGHKKMRPITLTTAKFSILSFRLFVQVLKTSASYLSMLLVVADQPDK
ncbi:odorant receptor 4-like isoform X2 [Diachasmimorpha longicaudata]|uniref:odorant receptor 4-like isoform X2 n=1 Tax=Diachasmimorpha longicaudata TaxID=58733 RepID=UPI0030B8D284